MKGKQSVMRASVLVHSFSDLQRQSIVLAGYCEKHGWEYEIISDIGSGINYNKRGLTKLMRLLLTGEVKRLVVTHKDQGIFTFDASQGKMPRLLRFGSELIFSLCEQLNVEVIMNNNDVNATDEQELLQEFLEIITVFSARWYGLRSHQNKSLIEELDKNAKKISVTYGIEL